MKLHFPTTDYGDFIANEASPLHSTTSTVIVCDFAEAHGRHSRGEGDREAGEGVQPHPLPSDRAIGHLPRLHNVRHCFPLAGVISCDLAHRYGYMIDNIILLITGTLHERDTTELVQRCHPLGMYDTGLSAVRI